MALVASEDERPINTVVGTRTPKRSYVDTWPI